MQGSTPRVSFIVPCYRLAHYLEECVDSILSQTFENLEVLILDDCSPDNTPEVAASIRDPRVRYIRNEPNLGHLRNYNKGISLAKGEYIWLISADDLLRRPYVLQKYVEVMDQDPGVGFTFCPGIGLLEGQETGVLEYAGHGDQDMIFDGQQMFLKLLEFNSILSASGMVQRSCYAIHGAFPLDLPFAGDWYLWLLFSLHYKVAYFAEPMVYYRRHPLAMTNVLHENDPRIWSQDELAVLWRIRQRADEAGKRDLARRVDRYITRRALWALIPPVDGRASSSLTLHDFETLMLAQAHVPSQRRFIWSRVHTGLGDAAFWEQNYADAASHYRRSLKEQSWQMGVLIKYLLLRTGSLGISLRQAARALKRIRSLRSPNEA